MSNSILSPFGEIPNDWEYQMVIDNVDFLTGPAFDSSLFNTESRGARLVRGINLTQGSTRWSEEKTKYWDVELDSLKKFQLAVNDILIGMDGSLVGKNYAYLKTSDLPALLVQRVARLRARGNLHSKYLYYMYATDFWLDYVEVVKTNSGIPHISNGDIKTFRFPFPPLPEQQKIAAILTSVDEVIEKTQAQIDKLKDLKTAMMQELLTNGVGTKPASADAALNNSTTCRESYIPHTEFKDSPVGRIPKSWEVVPLIQFSASEKQTFVNGPFGSDLLSSELIDTGVPVIYVRDMKNKSYKHISKVCVTQEKADYLSACNVFYGDVLVAKVGDPPCNSGVYRAAQRAVVTQDVIRIRPSEDTCSDFLAYLLNSPLGRKQIEKIEVAGTRKRVSLTEFKKLIFPKPSFEEQKVISSSIKSVDRKVEWLQIKLSKTTNTKKALMQDLLTGKVRVKVD
jgi:type I restriction enzyme S subunit